MGTKKKFRLAAIAHYRSKGSVARPLAFSEE
jgi:hypothetical protein